MAGSNGSQNGNGSANGNGAAPAVHIPKPGAKQDVRQDLIRDPYTVIPHVSTYSGIYNATNKDYYIYWDEALRNSQSNTLAMRRDGYVHELIRHRQLPVVSLPHHIEVDDPEHPDQIAIAETIHKIFSAIPNLQTMMLILMEAVFYGRYGVQVQMSPSRVGGNLYNSINKFTPINGDKFRYKWDGTPGIAIYSGAQQKNSIVQDSNAFLVKYSDYIETSMLGPALFLKNQFLRDRFVIHNFEPFDTDYLFEIEESQSVFGLGLRSRLYWTWNLRVEVLSWIMDALQRVGANGLLYAFYQSGNPNAEAATLNSLRNLVKDNISAFPMPPNNNDSLKDVIQNIPPSQVGYDIMLQLIQYLDGIMRRAFLGQDLSSESKPTGLGNGVADLQGDVRQDNIQYDANALAETLTSQPLATIARYNKWRYEGKVIEGWDLPFSMRLKFDMDKDDSAERLEAAKALWEMGVSLDEDDVRKAGGFSPPKKKATVLVNHQLEAQKQQNEAGTPQFNELNKSMKGLVGEGKKAQGMGLMGSKPTPGLGGKARFSIKTDGSSRLGYQSDEAKARFAKALAEFYREKVAS
jgi:Protein of unknown function (DUF935)